MVFFSYNILITFTKLFARTFWKVWSTCTLKNFCHSSNLFLSYNPSLNKQIFSLIDAQAHFQTQLRRAGWYRLSKILHCSISTTMQLTYKVKFQTYWLSFLNFFVGKQNMKTLIKVSLKLQRIPMSSFLEWIPSFPAMLEMLSLSVFCWKRLPYL